MSKMSDFSNKNVLFLHPFVPKIALKSRVDFSQPKFIGRLKYTLLAIFHALFDNLRRLTLKSLKAFARKIR